MTLKRNDFYALICSDWKYQRGLKGAKRDDMLCGVYPSEKEALEVAYHVEDCMCDHYIAKVKVTVTYARQFKIKKRKEGRSKKKPR